jgi:hypothetical protein
LSSHWWADHRAVTLVVAALASAAALPLSAGASAAPATDQAPSVSIRPAHPRPDAPNHGQWFVVDGRPGEVVPGTAIVSNPGASVQHVRLYLADLTFSKEGAPTIVDPPKEVGAWGGFDVTEVVLPAGGQQAVGFTVRVPLGTEPGDHIGAAVAESAPEGTGEVRVIKRVAARLYVTVPGAVRSAIDIVHVDVRRQRTVAPRWATITVDVRNTGTVRLATTVRVGGQAARGPALVMSRSTERYVIRRSLPVWGGPVSWPVEVDTRTPEGAGPTRTATAKVVVAPVVLLLALLLLALAGVALWQLRARRGRRLMDLAEQVERLEQRLGSAGGEGAGQGPA